MAKKEFKNSHLKRIRPEHLFPRNADVKNPDVKLAALMTMFAVYFNDLKGLLVISGWKKEYRSPESSELSSHAGEYNGIQNQLNRMIVSMLHELLVCMKKHEDIINSAKFQEYEEKLHPEIKMRWQNIKQVAIESDDKLSEADGLRRFLQMIRDNVGAHIQNPKIIVSGFNEHFYNENPIGGEKEDYVFYSYDRSRKDEDRFYYADAVTGAYLIKQIGEMGDIQESWDKTMKWSLDVTLVLAEVVNLFLSEKPEYIKSSH